MTTNTRFRPLRPTGFLLSALLTVLNPGCTSVPTTEAASASVSGADTDVEYSEQALRTSIREVLDSVTTTPCREAALLGVLDQEAAGQRLDALVAAEGSAADDCRELVAAARVVRAIRVGRAQLEVDLLSPHAAVRAVAVRAAVLMGGDSAATVVARGLTDAERAVRVAAYFAAAQLQDKTLLENLRMSPAPGDSGEAYWHCRARKLIDSAIECGEVPVALDIVAPASDEPEPDRCQTALDTVDATERRDALWFFLHEAFHEFVRPLDRLESIQRQRQPCRLSPEQERELVLGPRTQGVDRALVSASILWRRHSPIGTVKFVPVEVDELDRYDAILRCQSDPDCPSHTKCIRLPGGRSGGVCGNPKRAREQATVRVDVYSSGCWSFADCPPFYSCFYLDPTAMHGVCIRR